MKPRSFNAIRCIGVLCFWSGRISADEICHKGKTIDVAHAAVQAHLAHGDSIGSCETPDTCSATQPTAGASRNAIKQNPACTASDGVHWIDPNGGTPRFRPTQFFLKCSPRAPYLGG